MRYLSIMLFLLVGQKLHANTKPTNNLVSIGDHFLAPIHDNDSQKIFYVGSALTLTLVALRHEIVLPTQEYFSEHKPLGFHLALFGDEMGQLAPNLLYMGTHFLHGEKHRAKLMFKTTVFAGATTVALKYIVNEKRPNGGDRKSFPSGHTATAFAFASVVGKNHEWYFGAIAYTLATIVGLSRMNDNAHYLHDVVFGATIGMAYGYAFSNAMGESSDDHVSYMPLILKDGAGLNISYSY